MAAVHPWMMLLYGLLWRPATVQLVRLMRQSSCTKTSCKVRLVCLPLLTNTSLGTESRTPHLSDAFPRIVDESPKHTQNHAWKGGTEDGAVRQVAKPCGIPAACIRPH